MAASLHYILVVEKHLAVRTDLVDQEYMQILVDLGSLSQDSDQYIEQDNLAEKVAEDSLVDLCTAADLVRSEAYLKQVLGQASQVHDNLVPLVGLD